MTSCGVAKSHTTFNPIGVVDKGCVLQRYTFGHEVAHIFGAEHNPEAPNLQRVYPYGVAFLIPNTEYRTILA